MRNKIDTNETILKLREREKEMKCLYKVHDIIESNLPIDEFLMEITKHMWGGWQYPNITRVKITFEGKIFKEPGWFETKWVHSANIVVDDKVLGKIEVYYTEFKRLVRNSQFLPEEQKLLNTIAANVSNYIFNFRLKRSLEALDVNEQNNTLTDQTMPEVLSTDSDVHWIWRKEMVEQIADKIKLIKFAVNAMYLIGSVKNANCGPASDIDILIHFDGNDDQLDLLKTWFEGWSYCLSEMNFAKTGYKTNGLIDLHIITDDDIAKKDSFASMINATNDGARLIKSRTNG